jgi:hypothetical protein
MTKSTITITVTQTVFAQLQIGKTYRFDGQKGKVVAKHADGAGSSAVGITSTLPMVTVILK